jgi:hypothetical protein
MVSPYLYCVPRPCILLNDDDVEWDAESAVRDVEIVEWTADQVDFRVRLVAPVVDPVTRRRRRVLRVTVLRKDLRLIGPDAELAEKAGVLGKILAS